MGETDPDNAFNKLFALWGLRYVAGSVDPCSQAQQAGLECLTQRGSLAQLRLFNRPAVLNVIDSTGRAHQLVLAGLDEEKAQVDLGGAQREIGIGDLSRSWFGDYVLLWRPAAGGSQPLALGARSARVRWLRDSLRRVNGLPADAGQRSLRHRARDAGRGFPAQEPPRGGRHRRRADPGGARRGAQ